MPKPLILIDGSNWLYRAYFALPPLKSPQGEPTGMVRGFAAMLKKLLKDYAPERIAVVFDPPGKTWRDSIYAEYKATRDATPEDLSSQFVHVKAWVEAMGLPLLQIAGEEADDVMGTLTRQARENLDAFVAALQSRALAPYRFAVDGHTDATGPEDYNQALSERRAASVVDYLVAHGVEGDRLVVHGYGETRPRVADNPADPENRRVETRRIE